MPGKLAAARASREASERHAQLPRRAASTQGGLPTELEDASVGAESTTVSRTSGAGGRLLRNVSADPLNGQAPSPKHHPQQPQQPQQWQHHPHDAPASSQSVTFQICSGQHGLHGTPTATAAAIAQSILSAGGGGGGASASGPGSPCLPPRATSAAAVAPPRRTSGSQTAHSAGGGSGPNSAAFAGASIPIPDPKSGPWIASSGPSFQQRLSVHRSGAAEPDSAQASPGSATAAAGAAGPASSGPGSSGAAGAAAATAAAAAVGLAARGSLGSVQQPVGAASEQVWTATAPVDRMRSGTAAAPTHRHSRLRIAVTASEPSATADGGNDGSGGGGGVGSASAMAGGSRRRFQLGLGDVDLGGEAAAGSAGASEAAAQPLPDQPASPGRAGSDTMAAWTASATRAFSGAGSSSAGGTTPGATGGGGGAGAGSFVGRGRVNRRPTPAGSTGFGTVSELFAADGGRMEEPPSGESSFTLRQTPSDLEDEALERARARRAIRSITLASMGSEPRSPDGTAAAAMGPQAAAATAPGRVARAETTGAVIGGAAGPVTGDAAAPPNGASRVAIRLNHQPGHQRRPPNRHASMPAMKRDGAGSGGGGAEVGRYGGAGGGAAGMRKSPLMRPPLSGGDLADGVPEDAEAEDAASLQYGAMPDDGAGGAAGGTAGAAGDTPSGYSRMPSDSPGTSQMSVTSSTMFPGGGPASAAQQRQAPASGVDAGAAALGLAPAQQPQPASRLAGPAFPPSGMPAALMVRLPGLTGGSSSQRASFEEDITRPTPAFLLGGSGALPGASGGPAASGGGGSGAQGGNAAASPHVMSYAGAAADRPSHMSSRMLSGAHAQHSNSLAALHKAVERLMLQDSGLYAKVQASMKGISSLAKETNKLEFVRDASGATVINQYVVVKTLGRGAFGKVKLCLNTLDGQLYAVKMINRAHLLRQLQKPSRPLRRRAPPPRNTSDTGLMDLHHRTQTDGNLSISHTNLNSNFGNAAQAAAPARASMDDASPLAAIMREIAVMKKVDHPHVVRLHEVIDPPGSSYLMLVMEYCEGGCVMETRQQTGLTPLGEETAREYFRQACLGLDYLHYNKVVHGDLKPENMLVSGSGLLKIADFGSSRFMGGDPTDAAKTSCTPAFQSPEEIGHTPVNPFAADLWALACCLFCFVFGRLPFVGSCVVDIYRAILTRPHAYPAELPCSPALRDLLDRMLDKDPKKRLKLREVGHHEWVTAGGLLPPLQFLNAQGSTAEGPAPPPVIHVTHAEQVNAIDRSSLVSLVRARLKEKTCQPGEYLFKEGEEAHCVYMIMAGVVELTQHLKRPGAGAGGANAAQGHGHGGAAAAAAHGGGAAHGWPHGAAAAGGGAAGELGPADHDASFSVDLDESLTLDHPDMGQITEAMNIVDGKLHIDRQQAIEMRRRMQGNLLGDNAEYVVEVKGPGSVIGEIGMDNAAVAKHRVSARARGPVTVVKLTEENFFKALLQMYGEGGGGGGGGGSAASVTLTASSISEAVGGGRGAAGCVAAAPGLSAQHLMVMQYLEDSGSYAVFPPGPASAVGGTPGRFSMDAGAGPSTLGGRRGEHLHPYSLHYQHPHPHPQSSNGSAGQASLRNRSGHGGSVGTRRDISPSTLQPKPAAAAAPPPPPSPEAATTSAAGGGGSVVSPSHGSSSAARLATARGSSGAAVVPARALGLLSTGGASRGPDPQSMMLGVLNTIHSINASRGGGTSEEGIADL
ncbi:hypothetical protein PLESTF_000681800 [Pleodorina starrii]|nr:hypothetical protein PLESTF_000681800 [Pleodorina starrii]